MRLRQSSKGSFSARNFAGSLQSWTFTVLSEMRLSASRRKFSVNEGSAHDSKRQQNILLTRDSRSFFQLNIEQFYFDTCFFRDDTKRQLTRVPPKKFQNSNQNFSASNQTKKKKLGANKRILGSSKKEWRRFQPRDTKLFFKNQNEWKNILILIDIRDAISKSKMIFEKPFWETDFGFSLRNGSLILKWRFLKGWKKQQQGRFQIISVKHRASEFWSHSRIKWESKFWTSLENKSLLVHFWNARS